MRKFFQIASIAAFSVFLASSAGALESSQHGGEAMRYLSALHPDPQALLVVDVDSFEGTEILDMLQEELLQAPGVGDILLGTNSHIHELFQKAYLSIPDIRALDFEAAYHSGDAEVSVEMPMLLFETDLPKNMIRDIFIEMEPAPKRIETENAVLWVFRDDKEDDYGLAELPNGLIGLSDLPTIQRMSRLAAGKDDTSAGKLVEYGAALKMYHDAQSSEAAEGDALIWMGMAYLGKLYPYELTQSGFPYLPQTASMQLLKTPTGSYKSTIGAHWAESAGEQVAKLKYTAAVHPKNMLEFLSKMLPQGVYTAEGYIDHDPDMAELREGLEELSAFIDRNPDMDQIAFEVDIALDEGGATIEAESSEEMIDEIVRSIKKEIEESEKYEEFEKY